MTDVSSLTFVDPDTVDERWRIGIFGIPGSGKTVALASAPGPIVAVNADRPGAYRYARRHNHGTQIHEVRFATWQTIREVYEYVRDHQAEIGTVGMDPVNAIYDQLVRENTGPSGKPNWQKINETFMDLIRAFRALDVNLVLAAHEKVEKDENADTEAKVFPAFGGPSLVQKVMGEMDIIARIFRQDATEDEPQAWKGQFVTARGYQCKDSSNALGRTRIADLSEWIATANAASAGEPVPWDDEEAAELDEEAALEATEDPDAQQTLDEAA
jgi:hypothetical protein